MYEKTRQALLEELKKHRYGVSGEYNFDRLFKIYTTLEIKEIKDLCNKHRDFLNFVISHHDMLDLNDETAEDTYRSIIYTTIKPFTPFMTKAYYKFFHNEQIKYKNIIEKLIVDKNNAKVLDVGAGKVPYSSFLMAKSGIDVTAMDNFGMSEESIRNLGVEPKNEMFKSYTNISNYNFVAGKRPCGAIEAIVENCTHKGVPYFMELCSCEAPGSKLEAWYDILKSQDPDIQFDKTGTIAFHVEKTKSEMQEIIGEGFHNPDIGSWFGMNGR